MATRSLSQQSHLYSCRVNLIKKVKIENTWRFASVVPEANGKLKDKVLVGDRIQFHPEGSYFIEWRENGRRLRERVHKDEAQERARRKALELDATKEGLIQTVQPVLAIQKQIAGTAAQPQLEAKSGPPTHEPAAHRIAMGKAIDDYLDFIEAHRKRRTFTAYRYTLDTLLRRSYRNTFVDQVSRADIIDFMTYCYKLGLGKRTVYDKLVVVLQLFKRHGKSRLIEKSDWPDYVDAIRPIYEAEELEAMFRAASQDQCTLLKFLLVSGLRDQEIRYLLGQDTWHGRTQTNVQTGVRSRIREASL